MSSIANVSGLSKLPDEDVLALIQTANRIGMNPDWLAAIISFESAHSFSPAQPNLAGGTAVGLIQFMPATARGLGTSSDELKRMTFQEQLVYVEKYFGHRGYHSLADAYMQVLRPASVGSSDDSTTYAAPSPEYRDNRNLDLNHDDRITKTEAAHFPQQILDNANGRREIADYILPDIIPGVRSGWPVFGLVAASVIAVGAGWWFLRRRG